MVGKRAEKRSRPVASSQRWSTPCSAMRAAMARLTTSRGASSSTKRSPSRSRRSAPWPRSASESSGPGHGRVVQRGRVELHELDVGRRHAGPQRHGHAVAGRLGRVGGDREELAGAAGGQHDVVGPHLDRAAGPRPGGSARHADAAPALDQRGRGRTSPRAPRWPSGRWRRRAPARPRRRWPRRRRARPAAGSGHPRGPGPASPSPRGRTRRRARSARAPGPGPRRPGCARPPRRTGRRRRPACRPGAGRSSPRRRPSTAATPPWAQRVADWDSAPLVRTPSDRDGEGRAGSGQAHGGRQPGDPAAQDQDVEGSRPGPGGHAGSVSVSSASRRADASSITRLRPSTCTTRGT